MEEGTVHHRQDRTTEEEPHIGVMHKDIYVGDVATASAARSVWVVPVVSRGDERSCQRDWIGKDK